MYVPRTLEPAIIRASQQFPQLPYIKLLPLTASAQSIPAWLI